MARFSLNRSLDDARRSLLRFPLVLVAALISCLIASYMVTDRANEEDMVRPLVAAILAIPFFLSLDLAAAGRRRLWLWRLAGVLVLGGYFLSLPARLPEAEVIRFGILLAGLHLLVAVAPFLAGGEERAIWQFNKHLLLRLVFSLIFTAILFSGLALAMAALDQLLGVKWHDEAYIQLNFIMIFVFNTWFFLGGVPRDPAALAGEGDFPRPLRVLAQHILSSLVVVYLAILMAYLAKVIFTGTWPSGWIGWLVSGVAVAGLLSVVLLSPLQGRGDSRWVWLYFLIFHILMIPAAVMLALALAKRIGQYGWTEPRYILAVLTLWLMVVLVRFLLTRRVGLRFIPLGLVVLTLVMAVGPWGAVGFSKGDQLKRLSDRLEGLGLLVDGRLVPLAEPLDQEDLEAARAAIGHVLGHYGPHTLDGWLAEDFWRDWGHTDPEYPAPRRLSSDHRSRFILDSLGANEAAGLREPRFSLQHQTSGQGRFVASPIDGYAFVLPLELQRRGRAVFRWGAVEAELMMPAEGRTMILTRTGSPDHQIDLIQLLAPLFVDEEQPPKVRTHPVAEMTFDHVADDLKLRLVLQEVLFQPAAGTPEVVSLRGFLLLP